MKPVVKYIPLITPPGYVVFTFAGKMVFNFFLIDLQGHKITPDGPVRFTLDGYVEEI
jgi:hypothetical protein